MKSSTISASEIIGLVLRAVALAMGVAVVVLSILGVAEVETAVILLGIGLFTLAMDALDRGSAIEEQ
jgi:hypothetical protein